MRDLHRLAVAGILTATCGLAGCTKPGATSPLVSRESVEWIRLGMARAEAVALLGRPIRIDTTPSDPSTARVWFAVADQRRLGDRVVDYDGMSIFATFVDDHLASFTVMDHDEAQECTCRKEGCAAGWLNRCTLPR